MILIDFSQLFIRATMEQFTNKKEKTVFDENFLRHIAISTILSYKNNAKFSRYWSSNSDIVICIDGKDYWRKDIFPLYKKHRKAVREVSKFNWEEFYSYFNKLKEEFKENLPFYFIEIDRAEADDIISVACEYFCGKEHILIISSDKDFIQIQQHICPAVKQYSPYVDAFIDPITNDYDLFEHIVKGDSGDGIPNIFSEDDVFLDPTKRNKQIRKNKILQWKQQSPEEFCETLEVLKKYERNANLIDLRRIPKEIKNNIVNSISKIDLTTKPHNNFFNYLVKHKLMRLIERGNF